MGSVASVRRGGWAAGAIALVLTTALTGCAAPFSVVCPAIGWSNGLTVTIDGDAASVATVQLCTEDGCAPRAGEDASDVGAQIQLAAHEGNTWSFSTGMLDFDEVTVRMLAADGSVIRDDLVSPEWTRVGGSEQCGGPSQGTATVHM